jgi:hypothetical protein
VIHRFWFARTCVSGQVSRLVSDNERLRGETLRLRERGEALAFEVTVPGCQFSGADAAPFETALAY